MRFKNSMDGCMDGWVGGYLCLWVRNKLFCCSFVPSFFNWSKNKFIVGSVKELTFLAGLEEDGIVWGPEDDVSTPVHYQNGDLECCNSVLLASAWEAHLNHWENKPIRYILLWIYIYIYLQKNILPEVLWGTEPKSGTLTMGSSMMSLSKERRLWNS